MSGMPPTPEQRKFRSQRLALESSKARAAGAKAKRGEASA